MEKLKLDVPIIPEVIASSKTNNTTKPTIVGLTRNELKEKLLEIGTEPRNLRMRLNQIWTWIYQKGEKDFFLMHNISKRYRQLLDDSFLLKRPEIAKKLISADGTRKYLLRLEDGSEIETVYIPEKDRGTICISSQVGCTLNCSFCFTGTQKLVRNLTATEIVSQILVVKDDLLDWHRNGTPKFEKRIISNLVLMGMGEPLYNYQSVKNSLIIIMDNEGIALSKKRITLSTSGVVPIIEKVGVEIGCLLAISFHATTNNIRNQLVPINKKWNIQTLLEALRRYPNLQNSQRITFEYVMLKDINDRDADARRLVKLVAGIPSKINLIPFNPWPGAPYQRSTADRIKSFAQIINRAGYASPIRSPRGEDIMAACGQLKSSSERQKRALTKKYEVPAI